LPTSNNDAVDETRERRNATDEEGGHRTPVAGEFGRVAVDTVEVVHVRYRHVALSDNVVAAIQLVDVIVISGIGDDELSDENRCHGTQENGVSTEESKELCGRCENFPWNEAPAANDSSEQLTTADIDILGGERHEIVGGTDGVG
jgi:hypothetical protein